MFGQRDGANIRKWKLHQMLEPAFCVSTLKEALRLGKPDIFNTDQGSQFTSTDFMRVLLDAGVQINPHNRILHTLHSHSVKATNNPFTHTTRSRFTSTMK